MAIIGVFIGVYIADIITTATITLIATTATITIIVACIITITAIGSSRPAGQGSQQHNAAAFSLFPFSTCPPDSRRAVCASW
jgi:hypothetical protein